MAIDFEHIPNIVSFIRNAWPVGDEALAQLTCLMKQRNFPRRTLMVSEGEFAHNVWFMERGMTRSYWMVDGEEVTTSFSVAGCVVFSMDEVYYGTPSKEYVESIVPVEAYGVNINQLMELISNNLDLCNWWRVIHQNEYRRLHQSHKERLSLDATERYREFARQFPIVCRNARLTDIASYLGIAPATLSRVRRSLFF